MAKIDDKTMMYLNSMDTDMVKLGCILLLEYYSHEELRKFILWKVVYEEEEGFMPNYAKDRFFRNDYARYTPDEDDIIFIKDNKAIRMGYKGLVYRSLGMMTVYRDFDKLEKIYL